MSSDIEDILAAVQSLPLEEQKEVLRRLTASLTTGNTQIDRATADFWNVRTVDEIVREHHTSPVADLRTLALTDWPDEESADEMIEYVYSQRRADRTA